MRQMKENIKFINLETNGLVNPLGLEANPTFSWAYEGNEKGFAQQSYKIYVYQDDKVIFTSPITISNEESYVLPITLKRQTTYEWQVEVRTERDEVLLSPKNTFSMGLEPTKLGSSSFGKMISAPLLTFHPHEMVSFSASFSFVPQQSSSLEFYFGLNDYRYLDERFNRYHQVIDGHMRVSLDFSQPQKGMTLRLIRHAFAPIDREQPNLDSILYETTIKTKDGFLNKENTISFDCDANFFIHFNNLKYNGVVIPFPEKEKDGINYNPSGLWLVEGVSPYLDDIAFKSDGALLKDLSFTALHCPNSVLSSSNSKEGFVAFKDDSAYTKTKDGLLINGLGKPLDLSHGSSIYLRKEFDLKKKIKRATIYATSWGLYELQINGKSLGNDEYLKPGDGVYYEHLPYDTYELKDLVKKGKNAIGVCLSSGWWNDRNSFGNDFFGDRPAFACLLEVEYDDGSKELIKSDESWKYYLNGPLKFSSIYNGTVYDSNDEDKIDGYSLPSFDEKGWENASLAQPRAAIFEHPQLIGKEDESVRVLETLKPKFLDQVKRHNSRGYIFDFGENFGGLVRFELPKVKKGAMVLFRYGEDIYPKKKPGVEYDYGVAEGLLYTDNLRAALATDFYLCNGKPINYLPSFTYHGFRYAEISFRGLNESEELDIIKKAILTGVALSSYTKKTLSLETSNQDVNQLFKNVYVTAAANHVSIPTDCPQRDEREGWEGDFNVFTETDLYLSELGPFFKRYERIMAANAKHYPNATFGNVAPANDYKYDCDFKYDPNSIAAPIGWALAGLRAPYNLYKHTGDASLAGQYWESLERFMHAFRNSVMKGKKVLIKTGDFIYYDYCDWLAPKETSKDYVNNCFYLFALQMMGDLAKVLKKDKDAETYQNLRKIGLEEFKTTFIKNHKPIDENGKVLTSQSAYCLPLDFNLLSEEDTRSFLLLYKDVLKDSKYTMNTGFLGTPSLLPALSKNGEDEETMKLFLSHEYPSWLYEVDQGATSMWERWNSFSKIKGYEDVCMNSFSHYAFGAVMSWFFMYVGGIVSGKHGYLDFVLQPSFPKELPDIKMSYDSPCGLIQSEITLKTYKCVIPPNTTATLYLPFAFVSGNEDHLIGKEVHNKKPCLVYHLEAGSYTFNLK